MYNKYIYYKNANKPKGFFIIEILIAFTLLTTSMLLLTYTYRAVHNRFQLALDYLYTTNDAINYLEKWYTDEQMLLLSPIKNNMYIQTTHSSSGDIVKITLSFFKENKSISKVLYYGYKGSNEST